MTTRTAGSRMSAREPVAASPEVSPREVGGSAVRLVVIGVRGQQTTVSVDAKVRQGIH